MGSAGIASDLKCGASIVATATCTDPGVKGLGTFDIPRAGGEGGRREEGSREGERE